MIATLKQQVVPHAMLRSHRRREKQGIENNMHIAVQTALPKLPNSPKTMPNELEMCDTAIIMQLFPESCKNAGICVKPQITRYHAHQAAFHVYTIEPTYNQPERHVDFVRCIPKFVISGLPLRKRKIVSQTNAHFI